jgi:hypothetical protein
MHMQRHFLWSFLLILFTLTAVSISAQETERKLTKSLTVDVPENLAFAMPYPEGWSVARAVLGQAFGRFAVELEADEQRISEWPFAVEGYVIAFEYERIAFPMSAIYRVEDRTLENLQPFIMERYVYMNSTQVSETTIFRNPALRMRTVDANGNTIDAVHGFAMNIVFRFALVAPSAAAYDAFLPTWEALLEGIRVIRSHGRVDVGGYHLAYTCAGEGSPTVILEAGSGASQTDWHTTLTAVGNFTRVCSYDRAGHGASELYPGNKLQTDRDVVSALHTLLANLETEGPYVLVGHSGGGLLVRLYADYYPDDVVGLVLVESVHEEWVSLDSIDGLDLQPIVARLKAAQPLGDLPLVVLSAETASLLGETWKQWQPVLALLSSNSTHITVENTRHSSILNDPALVEAIRQVIDEVRTQRD